MKFRCIGYNRGETAKFVLKRKPRGVEYVMLVLRSRTFFVLGGETVQAPAGTVWIYDKTTAQHFGADGEPFLHDWVTFDLSGDERAELCKAGLRFDALLCPRDISVLSHLISRMQHEKYAGGAAAKEVCDLYLHILLLKLIEEITATSGAAGAHSAELGRLRAEIYAHPKVRRSAKDLADALHMSVSYFQHLYKLQFGVSPTADMIESRIEYAKDLLRSTDYTVKMVADELDYPSDIQFIRQFRSVCGQTPKAYRKLPKK